MTTGTTQFMHQKLGEEAPIFSKQRVNFSPTHPLTHLAVANNNIVMAMANRSIIRIDQATPDKLEEIDLTKTILQAKISNLFLDPTGAHLLISLKPNDVDGQPELYYLPKKWTKPKLCTKFRGNLVSAVGWSHENRSETCTGAVLAGTTLGVIIETELASDDRMFSRDVEQHWKQVFDIGRGQHVPVTGLKYFQVPSTNKYFVVATTPTRMYQFQGYINNHQDRPLLIQVFNNYLNTPERFLELPSSWKYSSLAFYYSGDDQKSLFPSQFGWLTEPGIYTGKIDPWEGDNDTVTVDCQLIAAPTCETPPRATFLTQFHALILYQKTQGLGVDRVKGVCLLNEQVVFDDLYDGTYGSLVGIAHDPVLGLFWTFTEYAVYKYKVVNEARNVWRIYLEKDQFELASRHCGQQPGALDQILTRQAEHLFNQCQFVESAMHYAKTKCSFEEVTLKFMGIDEKNALLNYLKKKLEALKSSEKTQTTLIVLWLVEIYQNKLGLLRDGGESPEYDNVEADFLALLKQPKVEECVRNNKETLYSLLSSHGDQKLLIHLADQLQDYERVVGYNLRNGKYLPVLGILQQQSRPELFYQFCPVLLQQVPVQTVDALVQQGRRLKAGRLLPALVMCTEELPAREALRYLEHQVSALGCQDPAVHNLLVSLYVGHSQDKLLPYLSSGASFDVKYALRLCVEAGLSREAVYLYTLLGQHETAVDLALTLDIDLATSCAAGQQAGEPLNEETSRKLWLKVAKHVVQEKQDIKQAMEFMHRCPTIKIEDILPFFPDFVTIDDFKAAICDSLQEYSNHIAELKKDMEEATSAAQVIRTEMASSKSRYQFVRSTDRCSCCSDFLLSRPFHLFSCGHRLHTDCLMDQILPHLTSVRQKRLNELQQLLLSFEDNDNQSIDSRSAALSRGDQARAEIDDIIASQCLFCGDIVVKSIDKPFIEDDEFDAVTNEWL